MLNSKSSDYCHIGPEERPRLVVVIDTEEEFDWSRDFSRDNISVRSMQWIGRIQDIFDEYGITPARVGKSAFVFHSSQGFYRRRKNLATRSAPS